MLTNLPTCVSTYGLSTKSWMHGPLGTGELAACAASFVVDMSGADDLKQLKDLLKGWISVIQANSDVLVGSSP